MPAVCPPPPFHGHVYVEVYLMFSFGAVSGTWTISILWATVLIPYLVQESLVAM